jgi:hypothetical protein
MAGAGLMAATFARATGARCAAAAGFAVTAQPEDRLPQWTHRRKIAPGSHHMP